MQMEQAIGRHTRWEVQIFPGPDRLVLDDFSKTHNDMRLPQDDGMEGKAAMPIPAFDSRW
jgi:hypothetical protein